MIDFTDPELGFIMMVMDKVDPTGIINEAANVRTKIRAYAEEKQNKQMSEEPNATTTGAIPN